jgi:hypothetical protein
MVDTGKELGADLGALWLCGRSYLPRVADAFLAGNAKADSTAAHDNAFMRNGSVGPGTAASVPGPVQPAWSAARDELQRVMAQTAANIYAASDTLIHVANLYATTDGSSAELIKEQGVYEYDATLPLGDPNHVYIENPDQRPVAHQPGD